MLLQFTKFLAMVLRHKPEKAGVRLDKHGWANVEKLIEGVNTAGKYHLDKETLQEIVRTNDKQRFSFSEDGMKIRANQNMLKWNLYWWGNRLTTMLIY